MSYLQGTFAMLALYASIVSFFRELPFGKNCAEGVTKREGVRQRGQHLIVPEETTSGDFPAGARH